MLRWILSVAVSALIAFTIAAQAAVDNGRLFLGGLTLFACGSAVALFGWRRKQKTQSVPAKNLSYDYFSSTKLPDVTIIPKLQAEGSAAIAELTKSVEAIELIAAHAKLKPSIADAAKAESTTELLCAAATENFSELVQQDRVSFVPETPTTGQDTWVRDAQDPVLSEVPSDQDSWIREPQIQVSLVPEVRTTGRETWVRGADNDDQPQLRAACNRRETAQAQRAELKDQDQLQERLITTPFLELYDRLGGFIKHEGVSRQKRVRRTN